jgi:ankyrin repeat protein
LHAVSGSATTLHDAIRRGDLHAIRAALRAQPALLRTRAEDGTSPVQWAFYTGQHAALALMLELGHEPDLFEAVLLGDAEALQKRLASDPAARDAFSPDGWSLAHLAAFAGHAHLIALLAEAGADLHARSRSPLSPGNTPLHAAVAGGRAESVRALLGRGADSDLTQEPGGYTPLHIAASQPDAEIVKLLIGQGADLNRRTGKGETPLAIALARKQQAVADVLRCHGAVT